MTSVVSRPKLTKMAWQKSSDHYLAHESVTNGTKGGGEEQRRSVGKDGENADSERSCLGEEG